MSKCETPDTILRLRALREKLCGNDAPWKEAFEVRDIVVEQLCELHVCANSEGADIHIIQQKIVSILEYLHVDVECNEESG